MPLKTFDEYQQEAKRTAVREFTAYPRSIQAVVETLAAAAADAKAVGHPDAAEIAEGAHILSADVLCLHDVLIWSLGLAGEAGEVADFIKKVYGHGKAFDKEALKKELGDVLWYLSNLADAYGLTLAEVAQANVDKLRARYPNGFTVAEANAPRECTPEEAA